MNTLDYLFTAEYTDGTTENQTPEDISHLDQTRNCYYDVLQSGKTIRRFSLVGKGNTITVDLGTGLFSINSLPVILESKRLPCLPEKFELVWYHQTSKSQNVTFDKNTGAVIKKENLPEFREYFIGWRCEIQGKEYIQKIGVS